jgi:RNA polymerase sigma factor (sigma-70 family)
VQQQNARARKGKNVTSTTPISTMLQAPPTQMPDWDTILKDHSPAVWRTCWRILSHRADVEEVFQETFLAALKVSRSAPVASWPALLHSLATARSVDRLRQRVTRRRVFTDDHHDPSDESPSHLDKARSEEPQPADHALASELSDRLRLALTALPEKQAHAFCLHALEGWPQQQVADALGMTENAVAVTIHRARHRLKELLSDSNPRREKPARERLSHVPSEAGLKKPAPVRTGGVL